MLSTLNNLFGSATYLPHGYCLLWQPDLLALHAVSDAAIALAYFAIPVGLIRFARRREDLPTDARRALGLFAAFIVACACTHLVGLLTIWFPFYGFHGLTKAATAVISLVAAYVFWRLVPVFSALPSPAIYRQLNEKLQAEIAAREAAYQELEESRASLAQEVDDKTHDLQATQRLFDMASQHAPITVYEQDSDLRILWIINPRIRGDQKDVVGKTDFDLLPHDQAQRIVAVKRRVMENGRTEAYETYLPTPDGERLFRLHMVPARADDGSSDESGLIVAAIDITDSRDLEVRRDDLTAQLTMVLQRLNVALRASGLYVFTQDRKLRYLWISATDNPFDIAIGDEETAEDVPEAERRRIEMKQAVMETGEGTRTEFSTLQEDGEHWYSLLIEPKRDVDDDIIGVVCAAMDITERKRHEQQMRVVMRELSHRSKNLMAVIQAIARQTARNVDSAEQFAQVFGQRVQAIASAQDLIVAVEWGETPLRDLIERQLSPFRPDDPSRVVLDGAPVKLSATAVQALALTIHELATNALKYGAFSNDTGEVHISWHTHMVGDEPTLHLEWQESGGPPVAEPSGRGFGRTVIEANTASTLDADVDLAFVQEGLLARFDIPLRTLSR